MPNYFYLDASALAKRYAPEPGSLVVDHLFSRLSPQRMFVLHLGVAEVVSILVRKYNAQRLSFSDFSQAFANVGTEIINQSALRKPAASAKFINASLALISKHSINATDAVLLRSALDMAAGLRASGDDLVLVASDWRLLRAGQTEGLQVFNPEKQTTTDLDLLV